MNEVLLIIGSWIIFGLSIWFVVHEVKKTITYKLIKTFFTSQ